MAFAVATEAGPGLTPLGLTPRGLTPLGRRLAALIAADGPIGVDRYMALALGDSRHGYYMTRDPLGVAGDFTTSPEISQVFGEIIGAWCAEAWRLIGMPSETHLIELGPGRGTLAADVLRALKVVPACRQSIRLHLVETSPVLRARQQALLAATHGGIDVRWHATLDSVPGGPFLLLANEFFDALPIRQFIRADGVWRERLVGLDQMGRLAFVSGPPLPAAETVPLDAAVSREGSGIFETCTIAADIAARIGRRLAIDPGVALVIDYGHRMRGFGETLQAVSRHRFVDVLDWPGKADLTAHVDLAVLARALRESGATVHGPVFQRDFLTENGAVLRSEMLQHRAPEAAHEISQGVDRLIDPQGMGTLFQVLAANSPGLPGLPGV